jgi:diguanylate cyclase (GGDEF)-like protein
MSIINATNELDAEQLLAVIATQTEIAKLGLDLNGVMSLVAEQALAVTHATGAVVEMVEGDEMVYRAVAGAASGQLGLRLSRDRSLSGSCVMQSSTLRCDDSEVDPRVNREACRKIGLRSMIVVPLLHHGIAIGVLKVFSSEVSAFGDGDLRILGLMSELIAASMFHSSKYEADELFQQATRDSLTGFANRALFFDRLRHNIAKARRERLLLGVMMLDMDALKPINDGYGHRAGDAAIVEMAHRIAADVRHSDTVARLGGDEFAVVLWNVESHESAMMVGRRIAERCDEPFEFEGHRLTIGASVGVAIFPDDGDQTDELVEQADRAMYVAKRAKKLAAASANAATLPSESASPPTPRVDHGAR